MSKIHFKDADGLQTLVSGDFGDWSRAIGVDQDMINDFANLTGDHQWIHVVGQDERPAVVYELMMVLM